MRRIESAEKTRLVSIGTIFDRRGVLHTVVTAGTGPARQLAL